VHIWLGEEMEEEGLVAFGIASASNVEFNRNIAETAPFDSGLGHPLYSRIFFWGAFQSRTTACDGGLEEISGLHD
jgi:hypothetical protein